MAAFTFNASLLPSSSIAGCPLTSSSSSSSSPSSCCTKPAMSYRIAAVRCVARNSQEQVEAAEQQMWRRSMVVGAGAALLSVFATGGAIALEKRPPGDPKPGTKSALKKYANICVSQPTASICHG